MNFVFDLKNDQGNLLRGIDNKTIRKQQDNRDQVERSGYSYSYKGAQLTNIVQEMFY